MAERGRLCLHPAGASHHPGPGLARERAWPVASDDRPRLGRDLSEILVQAAGRGRGRCSAEAAPRSPNACPHPRGPHVAATSPRHRASHTDSVRSGDRGGDAGPDRRRQRCPGPKGSGALAAAQPGGRTGVVLITEFALVVDGEHGPAGRTPRRFRPSAKVFEGRPWVVKACPPIDASPPSARSWTMSPDLPSVAASLPYRCGDHWTKGTSRRVVETL